MQPFELSAVPLDPAVGSLARAGAPWAAVAAAAAESKLGMETVILEVGEAISVTEHFVITSGNSNRQVRAIVNEIEVQVKAAGGPSPLRMEGNDTFEWVLLDYGEFVVHVFAAEMRPHYQLERLWKDCPQLDWRGLA